MTKWIVRLTAAGIAGVVAETATAATLIPHVESTTISMWLALFAGAAVVAAHVFPKAFAHHRRRRSRKA